MVALSVCHDKEPPSWTPVHCHRAAFTNDPGACLELVPVNDARCATQVRAAVEHFMCTLTPSDVARARATVVDCGRVHRQVASEAATGAALGSACALTSEQYDALQPFDRFVAWMAAVSAFDDGDPHGIAPARAFAWYEAEVTRAMRRT